MICDNTMAVMLVAKEMLITWVQERSITYNGVDHRHWQVASEHLVVDVRTNPNKAFEASKQIQDSTLNDNVLALTQSLARCYGQSHIMWLTIGANSDEGHLIGVDVVRSDIPA